MLLVDSSYPLVTFIELVNDLCHTLENIFAVATNIGGPSRMPFFSLMSLSEYPEVYRNFVLKWYFNKKMCVTEESDPFGRLYPIYMHSKILNVHMFPNWQNVFHFKSVSPCNTHLHTKMWHLTVIWHWWTITSIMHDFIGIILWLS